MSEFLAGHNNEEVVRMTDRAKPLGRSDEDARAFFRANVLMRGPDECWPWVGYRVKAGYGSLMVRGKAIRAHRFAWEVANASPIPPGMFVCHRCDNPPCVNPKHLFLGTDADNVADRVAKGRSINGPMRRTKCPNGHPYDATDSRGFRTCRACIRDGRRRRASEAAR